MFLHVGGNNGESWKNKKSIWKWREGGGLKRRQFSTGKIVFDWWKLAMVSHIREKKRNRNVENEKDPFRQCQGVQVRHDIGSCNWIEKSISTWPRTDVVQLSAHPFFQFENRFR